MTTKTVHMCDVIVSKKDAAATRRCMEEGFTNERDGRLVAIRIGTDVYDVCPKHAERPLAEIVALLMEGSS